MAVISCGRPRLPATCGIASTRAFNFARSPQHTRSSRREKHSSQYTEHINMHSCRIHVASQKESE